MFVLFRIIKYIKGNISDIVSISDVCVSFEKQAAIDSFSGIISIRSQFVFFSLFCTCSLEITYCSTWQSEQKGTIKHVHTWAGQDFDLSVLGRQ